MEAALGQPVAVAAPIALGEVADVSGGEQQVVVGILRGQISVELGAQGLEVGDHADQVAGGDSNRRRS